MNRLIQNKIKTCLAAGVTTALIGSAFLLGVSGLRAQSQDKQKKETQADWPETAPYNAAIQAFDAALTRAGWDLSFRQRLIKSSHNLGELQVCQQHQAEHCAISLLDGV